MSLAHALSQYSVTLDHHVSTGRAALLGLLSRAQFAPADATVVLRDLSQLAASLSTVQVCSDLIRLTGEEVEAKGAAPAQPSELVTRTGSRKPRKRARRGSR